MCVCSYQATVGKRMSVKKCAMFRRISDRGGNTRANGRLETETAESEVRIGSDLGAWFLGAFAIKGILQNILT